MTTKRFNKAVDKLYKAYNEGTLNANDCRACAVGNIVGHGEWFFGNSIHNISSNNNTILKHNISGYLVTELIGVEKIFLKEHIKFAEENGIEIISKENEDLLSNKEVQFKGLIAVINYLAELDGIKTIDEQYNKFLEVYERELAE